MADGTNEQGVAGRSRWIWGVGAATLVWIFVCVAVQAGPRALGLGLLLVASAAGLVAVVFGLVKLRAVSVLPAAVVPIALWIGLWGSYSFTRDVLGGFAGVALAWPATRLLTRLRQRRQLRRHAKSAPDPKGLRPRRRFVRRFVLICFVLVWAINSSLDVLFESRAEVRVNTPLLSAQAVDASWPATRVGVALSGGGYRAAIMHAGVLAELDAMRAPVTALSSVSGGSIIGSFYAAGGAPETFRDAMAAGRMNLKRDMADLHNAVRLPFPAKVPYTDVELLPWFSFGRVDVQANLVDRVLLGGTTLRDLNAPGLPLLQVCTTDLRSGAAVGLAADSILLRSAPRPTRAPSGSELLYEVDREVGLSMTPDTRVADLVAASGAFPGAFSAVNVTLPATGTHAERRLLLADGGIVDNWGVGLLLDRSQAATPTGPWRLDVLLVSAGGRIFDDDDDVPGPEELRRAIDIVYETAGWRPVDEVGGGVRPPIILLQPRDVDRAAPEYLAFAEASTLTDAFTEEQAQLLFDLGRRLVRNAAPTLLPLLEAAQRDHESR